MIMRAMVEAQSKGRIVYNDESKEQINCNINNINPRELTVIVLATFFRVSRLVLPLSSTAIMLQTSVNRIN